MTISDEVFKLIKSLKQAEKRYYKVFATLHNKEEDNIYLELFEAIDKQDEYDEARLLEKYDGKKFAKNFAVTKNYLYNLILKALRSYHAKNDVEAKINEGLEFARILYGKGLYKGSLKILSKTKSMARTYQKFELILNILRWERLVAYRYLDVGAYYELRESLQQENDELIKIISNKYKLSVLEDKVYEIYRTYSVARSDEELDKYRKIIEEPVLNDSSNALSFHAQWSFNNINAIYYSVQELDGQALKFDEEQIRLLDENPKFKEDNLYYYVRFLSNLAFEYAELNEFDLLQETIGKLRNVPVEYPTVSKTIQAIIFEMTFSIELTYYLDNGQFERALEFEAEVQAGLEEFKYALLLEFKISIMFVMAKLYFYVGNSEKSQNWISRIIYEEKTSVEDYVCICRLLNLLVHYDLKNYELLRYEIQSTKRFLRKRKRLYEVEKCILKHLLKLTNSPNEKKVLEKFKQDMNTILTGQFEQKILAFINPMHWIESKLTKRPLQQILEEEEAKGEKVSGED